MRIFLCALVLALAGCSRTAWETQTFTVEQMQNIVNGCIANGGNIEQTYTSTKPQGIRVYSVTCKARGG